MTLYLSFNDLNLLCMQSLVIIIIMLILFYQHFFVGTVLYLIDTDLEFRVV